MFEICISSKNGFTNQILAFSFSKKMKTRLKLLLTCQISMKTDRPNDDKLWWMMIECSKLVFRRIKTNLQTKFWPSAPQKRWRHVQNCCWPVRPQWKLTDLMVMNCDEWWLNVQNLYSAERKQIYKSNFWFSVFQKK